MLKMKIPKMPKMPKMPKIPTKILTAMGSYSDGAGQRAGRARLQRGRAGDPGQRAALFGRSGNLGQGHHAVRAFSHCHWRKRHDCMTP